MLQRSFWFALAFAIGAPSNAQVTAEGSPMSVEAYLGETARQSVTIHNGGTQKVTITAVKSENRMIEITLPAAGDIIIPAQSSKDLVVQVVSRFALGARRVPVDFQLRTDSGELLTARGEVRIFVESALDVDRPEIDLGVVSEGQKVSKSISLTSSEIPELKVTKVVDAPKFLSVTLADQGRALTVAPASDAPWGLLQGFVQLATNSTAQPEAVVHVQIDMRGEVVPSQNPVNFSPDNVGNEQEETVRLERKNKKPLKIRDVQKATKGLQTRVDECVPARDDCKLLRLVLTADAPSGQITGIVKVFFEGLAQDLPIQIGGFRLAKGQRLRNLNENAASQTSAALAPTASVVDIGKLIDQAQRKETAPAEPPPGTGPLLKWEVVHEATIFGYLIFRADREDGPFKRLNKDIVAASRDNEEDDGGSYQWRDTSAEKGKTYWYYVSAIENTGHKRKLTDPSKVVAK